MALPQTADVTHPLYPRVEDPKDAEGLAWVFKSKSEFVPYYFKFPALGEEEMRAKVLYTGLCHSDVLTGRELWGKANFPVCTGHEVVGQVTHIGTKVTNLKVGDLVGVGPFRSACFDCEDCKGGRTNLCTTQPGGERFLYGKYFGGYATHIQQPAHHTYVLPAGADLANIPPVLCAGCTVFAPMKRHITQAQGSSIAILGIGGLGHLAVQYAKKLGLHVAAFTSTPDKVDFIKKLGADEVIIVDKELKSLADNAGKFNYLVNTLPSVTKDALNAYLKTLKNNGTLIQVGLPDTSESFDISYSTLIMKQLKLTGSIVSSVQETKDTLAFTAEHDIRVAVEEFTFADFPKALDRLENGRPQFRCVVNVKDYAEKYFPEK